MMAVSFSKLTIPKLKESRWVELARKFILCFLFILGFTILEVYPASKEIIRLQADVTLLQQQIRDLQKSFDSQGAVLKTLVEQLSDQIAVLKKSVEEDRKSTRLNSSHVAIS